MDRFEAQKMRMQDLVKNHHSVEALSKDMVDLLKEHPEAAVLGVSHESFSDMEHDSAEIAVCRWGSVH